MENKIEELVTNDRFMLRIQTIHLINQLKEHVSVNTLNNLLAPHLFTLAADPVPNIRFNVSKTIESLHGRLSGQNKARAKEVLERMANEDDDFDAKFYAQKTLEALNGASAVSS